jgi:hypothetical protein
MAENIYEHGYVAMGNGDLIDVTDVTLEVTDNSKLIHTLRQKAAGTTQGVEEATLTFNATIPDGGEEADWLALVKQHEIKNVRIKVPGRTINMIGKYSSVRYEIPLDDAVKVGLTFIGKTED